MHDQGSTPSGMTLVANQVSTNPRLVNPPTDFHLQSNSPAINAGQTLATVTVDFEATSRPQGFSHDIGAFEHH
jgi:hypothetical protein